MASVRTQIPVEGANYLPNNFATQEEQVSTNLLLT